LNNPIAALTSRPILGWSLVRRLPDDTDPIFDKLTVDAHERQFLIVGLGDQQAVEWISMVVRERASPQGVVRVYRQDLEGVGGHLYRDRILGIGIPTPDAEPAATRRYRDLSTASRAEIHRVELC
jgi:hypothetical protein